MALGRPLMVMLPSPEQIRGKLGDALREVELLRALLRVAERAERYRAADRQREVRNKQRHDGKPKRKGRDA